MPMIIRYEGEVERQWPSRGRLRVVNYGPSGLAEGLEATGEAAESLREDLQRAKDIETAREVWHQDLTAGEFWKSALDQARGTPGYKAEAVVAGTEQRAPLVRDAILKRISTPEGRAVMTRRWDAHSTRTLAKMNADALAKRREAEDALHQRQLNQFIQDFCEAPDGQGFDHIARGNDRIADHAQFNGLSEEWQQAERQAFAGSAIEACVRSRLERGDPVAAKSMLDWGGKVMTPKAAAELRPLIDLQLSERQAERDADEVIGAVPSDDGSFDLARGLARIEAQDWPEPRKAQAARELRFRSGEARRQREAGYDEAGRAFGTLLDERRAAGTPITSLKQIPVELRAKLRPEVLQEFDAALQAQDAGERPQANSQLLGALAYLAATAPDEFRRRLVHPDLLRGRVTEAEAKNLWQMKQGSQQGANDGEQPEALLGIVRAVTGKVAATPEEQAIEGQIVFRVFQRVHREFKDTPPTKEQLMALATSELGSITVEKVNGQPLSSEVPTSLPTANAEIFAPVDQSDGEDAASNLAVADRLQSSGGSAGEGPKGTAGEAVFEPHLSNVGEEVPLSEELSGLFPDLPAGTELLRDLSAAGLSNDEVERLLRTKDAQEYVLKRQKSLDAAKSDLVQPAILLQEEGSSPPADFLQPASSRSQRGGIKSGWGKVMIGDGNVMPPIPSPPKTDPGSGEFNSEKPTWRDHWRAQAIGNGATLIEPFWDDAARHMRHFLQQSGEPLLVDVAEMLSEIPDFDKEERDRYNSTIVATAISHIRSKYRGGEMWFTLSSPWKGFQISDGNWFFALGEFYSSHSALVHVAPNGSGMIEVSIKSEVHVHDSYNWNKGKKVKFGPFTIRDDDMARLHRTGLGREYLITGQLQRPLHRFRMQVPTSQRGG